MDEVELIHKTLEGDGEAFATLVAPHREKIYHHCLGIVKEVSSAEDLTQEVFLHAFQHLDTFKMRSSFYTWLYRIAHNLSLNYLKREQRRIDVEHAVEVRQTFDPTLFKEVLHLLPEKQRQVFELYYFEQLTQKEVAERLGIAHGTVRSRLHYAKERLRELCQ